MKPRKHSLDIFIICVVLLVALLVSYKIVFLNYGFSSIIPQVSYNVDVVMTFQGFGESVNVKTYLPVSDSWQSVGEELNSSPGFLFEVSNDEGGRLGSWSGENVRGSQQITYSFAAQRERLVYQIDSSLTIPESYPEDLRQYLAATDAIQVNDPFIEGVYRSVVPPTRNTSQVLHAIFDYVHGLEPMPFKGLTDAVTAARLGEASCNGKSRLLAALARRAGIPVRLVGGLILTTGSKRTSHQWVEAFVNGYWVPFDALNDHFAELPATYLVLYRGDEMLFAHTANINFGYAFKVRKELISRSEFFAELGEHPLNAYSVWATFTQAGIPLSLLKIIIMIPLGAFIVAVFRNVIGLETFGTFLPALIAAASRETGFLWGAIGFIAIIGLVSLAHYPLEKWGILHTPKMAINLICVVTLMLTFTVVAVRLKLMPLAYVTLFPIAVMTITAERFALLQIEEGSRAAWRVMFTTIVVVGFCYLAMNSLAMEALFLAFPELILILLVLNLWLGRWIGIRLTEFRRFRWLAGT